MAHGAQSAVFPNTTRRVKRWRVGDWGSASANRRYVYAASASWRGQLLGTGRFQRGQGRPKFAARQQAWPGGTEHRLSGNLGVKNQADESIAHLVPILETPENLFRRIGIELVV